MKIKTDIISGFLGAGKTTLIKKLLEENLKNQKLVLIENEFGDVSIDGPLLKSSGIEIRELNSGCICCSLVGDFEESIKEVIARYKPERIIIEPSGVGKLSDIIAACELPGLKEALRINMLVTVVDVLKYQIYIANFGEFYENQVANAKTIMLSRTQKAPAGKLEKAVDGIRRLNKKANIITTPWESLKAEQIIAVAEGDAAALLEESLVGAGKTVLKGHGHGEGGQCGSHDHDHGHGHEHHEHHEHCGCGGHTHSHHAEEVFEVWNLETPRRFEQAEIKALLGKLADEGAYGTVLRGKGILQDARGQWMQVDYVPGEIKTGYAAPDYTGRLVIIGSGLNRSGLDRLFRSS